MAERVTAAEKNAEEPRPLCKCHQVAMRWRSDGRQRAGGVWRCVVKGAAYDRQRASKQRRLGLCKDCNEPVIDGQTRCQLHQQKNRDGSRDRLQKKRIARGLLPLSESRAKGLCDFCGKDPSPHSNIEGVLIQNGVYLVCLSCSIKQQVARSKGIRAYYEANRPTIPERPNEVVGYIAPTRFVNSRRND